MTMPEPYPDIPPPDPLLTALIYKLIRYILWGLSAAGITLGSAFPDNAWMTIAGAIVGAGTVIWSIIQTKWHRDAAHRAAVRSAEISAVQGRPVVITPKVPPA